MRIDSATGLCCLIGHPVSHSVSPQMHNSAFEALGINCVYLAFDVEPMVLGEAVRGLRSIGVKGFNVTIPHKVEVMKFLDELDESAIMAGAVNTVALENGALKGYNTDVYGIVQALRGLGLPDGRPGLVIGAGGAARAAVAALINMGFDEISVVNRTRVKAEKLAERVKTRGVACRGGGLEMLREEARRAGLIINATPIGMNPGKSETLLKSGDIPAGSAILDLVYNPVKTRLLREAEEAGAKPVSGIEVLVYQGAKAFELWTGREAPIEVMRRAALSALREGWQ